MRVRLTNAAGGFLMWSEMFREELEDVFGGRDRIAGQIAQNLQLKPRGAPRPAKAVNSEAYRLVPEARHVGICATRTG